MTRSGRSGLPAGLEAVLAAALFGASAPEHTHPHTPDLHHRHGH